MQIRSAGSMIGEAQDELKAIGKILSVSNVSQYAPVAYQQHEYVPTL